MRLTSLFLSAALLASLAYWFWLRHLPEGGAGAFGLQSAAVAPAGASATGAGALRAAEPAVPVMVLTTTEAETENRLVLRGRTKAARSLDVKAETTGRITSEPLRRGTRIAAGDLLCRIEPGARSAQLAEAEARLVEAEVEANAATQLSARGFAAETTRTEREAARQAAQAAVDLVRLDIERLEIRAPFSGLLESDTAELGARLAIGDVCARIIDLSEVKVSGFISEQDVGQVSVGDHAAIRLVDGRSFDGAISFVSRMADEATRTYEVEVTIPNPDLAIRDGMTAELLIDLPPVLAHLVPQSALTLDDDGRLGVRLSDGGRARFVPVRVIGDAADGAWIAGLPPKAEVIVVGHEFVRDGRAILPTPVTWEDLG